MKIVFISGKVGNGISNIHEKELEKANNKFSEAEDMLIGLGFKVINPMKLQPIHGTGWESYMRSTIRELTVCDYIYLLPDWESSKGAKEEKRIADMLGIKQWH